MSSKGLSTSRRFLRYLLAVVVGFTADVVMFLLLSWMGASILPANAAGFLVGFSVNVLLIRLAAFPGTPIPGHVDFAMTFVVNVCVMLVGSLIIWTLTTHLGSSLLFSKVLANGCTLLINFSIRNFLDRYWTCFPSSRRRR